ncbi:MFS transporter [Actinomadura macrotermitis]|uniref:Putative MFS-type transporter EfpA n=1 Tax=Actinomadura macrotermitis TaxID=2585200 RepID=A0A7K0C7R8_9ACTN|nr:MFS transporter [Actinomadura macrotermitis]MQY09500.1 putative MFS-type transporter EfpA [Actinomadura macrotermitis]
MSTAQTGSPVQRETAPAAPPALTHPALALSVIVGCQLMIGLDTSVVTIALPGIRADLGLTTGGLAWVQNSYMIAFGGLLLLGGRAGDVFGRRRVFGAGIALFTLASLLGGFATAGWTLIAARALQGAAAAVAAPSAMALIAASFTGAARVRALSIFSAVVGAGAAVGMVLGGVLTEAASWHWVFFINVPLGVLLVVLVPRVLPAIAPRPGRFDAPGALAATLGMTALVYGFVRAASDGWRDGLTLAAFAAALVLLTLLLLIESRAAQPLMPLWLFTARDRAGSYAGLLLAVAGMFGSFFFLTQYLQQQLGYGPLRAGFAFLPLAGLQFATVRIVPRLLPRLGARPIVTTGAVLLTAALLWLSRLDAGDGYAAALLGPFLLLGMGGGLIIMPLNATVLASVDPADAGAASGVAQTMLWGGGAVGGAVLVTVYGAASRPDGTVAGMTAAFAAGAVFTAGAALAALLTLRARA